MSFFLKRRYIIDQHKSFSAIICGICGRKKYIPLIPGMKAEEKPIENLILCCRQWKDTKASQRKWAASAGEKNQTNTGIL